jgi:coproporphyrinogen III oxidase
MVNQKFVASPLMHIFFSFTPKSVFYKRGVKFGLQTANPRVEGVMVSAPPEIAYEYNHVTTDERELELLEILRNPIPWVS